MSLCRRCQTPIEAYDLRCAICALAVDAGAGAAPAAGAARILRCGECGAAVAYQVEAQAAKCAFCDAVMEVETPVDPIDAPEWLLPFTVDKQTAQVALQKWLGTRGWLRPGDLAAASTIDTLRPIYWAAWIFDAEATVTWAADSDAGARRSAWAPHAGRASFDWKNIVVSASRGLTAKETTRLAPAFRLSSAVAVGGQDDDTAIESFDVQRSAARKKIVEAIEAIAARQLQDGGHIPGSRFRNVHASVRLARLHTRRVVLPTWVLAYRYGGSLYRALVHGQDPAVAFGDAPISWAKVIAIAAVVIVIVALVLFFVGR